MVIACCPCHLSCILESRLRGAAHTYGPMGGSALAQRAELSRPWLRCRSLQRRDNAESGHGVQIPPELPGVVPAKSPLSGLECGLGSRQGISSVQSGVHVCLLAGAFRGTRPPAHSFPVPFWCGHCWLCLPAPLSSTGKVSGQRRDGVQSSSPRSGLDLGTTSTYCNLPRLLGLTIHREPLSQ